MEEVVNKRQFPRALLKVKSVIEWDGVRYPATIQDIAVKGVSFVLDQAIPEGTQIIVSLEGGHPDIHNNILKCKILRNEDLGFHFLVAAVLTEPNDQYTMDALAVVNGNHTELLS